MVGEGARVAVAVAVGEEAVVDGLTSAMTAGLLFGGKNKESSCPGQVGS
jgi:hypothetical protein